MLSRALRYRTWTSFALVSATTLALVAAAPGPVSAATTPATAVKPAGADSAKTKAAKPALDPKAARAKSRADARAAHDAARQKRRDAAAKLDRSDVEAQRPWVRGANWIDFRVGTAAASERGSPSPGPGFGFGSQHFISRRYALGLQFDYDLLGKYAGAAEMEVPMHVELTRHYDWGDAMRPYFGLSTGATWHRLYRTGADAAGVRPSMFFVGGANTPIGPHSLMGVDFRVGWENDARSLDPVFPNDSKSLLTWRAKMSYMRWR